MRNLTLSADERDIEAARTRARSENTTLNEQFRRWLASYAHPTDAVGAFDDVVADLAGKLVVGRGLTREEMNER